MYCVSGTFFWYVTHAMRMFHSPKCWYLNWYERLTNERSSELASEQTNEWTAEKKWMWRKAQKHLERDNHTTIIWISMKSLKEFLTVLPIILEKNKSEAMSVGMLRILFVCHSSRILLKRPKKKENMLRNEWVIKVLNGNYSVCLRPPKNWPLYNLHWNVLARSRFNA